MDHLRVSTPWLRPLVTPSLPTLQLILLPHAGGSAHVYGDWASFLPGDVALAAVEYPGHGARVTEPVIDDPAVMVAEVTDVLREVRERLDGRPLIIGGHSLGALLAHEAATVLQAAGRPVDGLLLSGALPAHRRTVIADLSTLTDDALAVALGADGDIPAEILEDAEARAFYLPMVRQGLVFARELCRAVVKDPSGREPVHAPTVVIGGADDARCPAAGLDAWAEVVDGPLETAVLPGGHFFYRQELDTVGRLVGGLVDRARCRRVRS
nr:pyochelin biosynthesis editing thioesterase PchC [Streptomyces sp. Xyl84]